MLGYFRKGLFVQKLDVGAASTKTSGLNVTGAFTLAGGITLSTAAVSAKTVTATSSVTASKGFIDGAETRTTLAQLVLSPTVGLSLVDASTAGAGTRAFTLAPPGVGRTGAHKWIVIKQNAASTRVITVATTAAFYNSTTKTFATVTGKARKIDGLFIELVAASSGLWALLGHTPASTAWTLA